MLLRQLSYFIAVAEHCGLSRAAAALHVSQPALSQQIRQLEAMLEVQLFDRSGRYTRLTDAGEIWLEYARRVLRDLEEGRRALHDAEDLQRGKLRIAMTPTGVPKAWMSPRDFAFLGADGSVLKGHPSSERLMHLAIYGACPEARVVVHAHPPTAIAWTLAHPDGTPTAMAVSAPAVMSPLVSVRVAGITLGERVNATCHVTISDGQESDRTTTLTGRSK